MQIDLPPGMTADKLRSIAVWMDIHDEIAQLWLDTLGPSDGDPELVDAAREAIDGAEIQEDLMRWADHLERALLETPASPQG